MAMSAIAVLERAKTAIELGESHFREFKSALEGAPGSKTKRPVKEIAINIAQTLVAFANADGGELLIGVEDNGEVTGLPGFTAGEFDALENAPSTRVHKDTPLPSVRKYRLKIDNKDVMYFSVPKSIEYVHVTADGRCMQRRDLESVPVAAEAIQFDRREVSSREYDRVFIDGVTAEDLDLDLVKTVADQVLKGMSVERCLQYLELAEYGMSHLRYRRAALLLFAKNASKWHPRLQIRILKIDGNEVGSGETYNVIADQITSGNILTLINQAWEALRPHLVQTRMDKDARFEQRSIYPELACREALLNAIAHRDYSDEGRGTEVYIFDDHLEIRNPGALLTSIRIEDIMHQKGVHQSRNTYVSRVLRELGYMRELGEGMRRIYDLMNKNELAPPRLESRFEGFSITLTNKAMYSAKDALWLSQFDKVELSREEKSVILLGQDGRIFSASQIWDAVGIVDTEDYRKLVDSLNRKGILVNAIEREKARTIARRKKIPFKEYPRLKIEIPPSSSMDDRVAAIKVMHANTEREPVVTDGASSGSGQTIHIGNLPSKVRRNDLYDLFSGYGSIAKLVIPMNNGSTKGYGFIEFEDGSSTEDLLNTQVELIYAGRKLIFSPAIRKTNN